MALENSRIAFIGSGVMAEAMIRGLLDTNLLNGDRIVVSDPRKERGQELVARYNLHYAHDNAEAARGADIIVLSTKPQVMGQVAKSLDGEGSKASLVLSILAGVRIRTIADALGKPNPPLVVGIIGPNWARHYGMDGDR